jgi:prolyl oligopeptidase PreP (S9A serine peptidase family)
LGPDGVTQTRLLKSLPAQFNAAGLVEQQFLATSADGTKVSNLLVILF